MLRASYLLLLLPILFTACSPKPIQIKFNYIYDTTKEVLDTTNHGSDAWYVPIEQDYVRIFNGTHQLKNHVDATTLSGIFRKPLQFLGQRLKPWELAGKERYYINISSEGYGFEGYAIVSFIRTSAAEIDFDAAYGSFSDNIDRAYQSSYLTETADQGNYADTVTKYSNIDHGNAIYAVQSYSTDVLKQLRKHNTLFFGLVPPAVASRCLSTAASSLVVEMTPEEYEYRLLHTKTKFRSEVRAVNRDYLYGGYQQDWRELLRGVVREEATLQNDPTFRLLGSLQTHAGDPADKALFPHLEIQDAMLQAAGILTVETAVDSISDILVNHLNNVREKIKPFVVSKKNSQLQQSAANGLIELDFDTADDKHWPPFGDKSFLGLGLIPFSYVGPVVDGKASGKGELYLGEPGADTIDFLAFSGNFKQGVPDGAFQLTKVEDHYEWMVATGTLTDGVLNGPIFRRRRSGDTIASASYKSGEFQADQKLVYHHRDFLHFGVAKPKLSDAYLSYIDHELIGMEIAVDTTIQGPNFRTFVRDSVLYIEWPDRKIVVPVTRDYAIGQIVPSTKPLDVLVYFNTGAVLQSNWDPTYTYQGASRYFPDPKNNGYFDATVTNGVLHVQDQVQVSVPQEDHNWFHRFVHFVTHTVVAPLQTAGAGINWIRGKESAGDAFKTAKASVIGSIGEQLQMEGSVVQLLGKDGQSIFQMTYPSFKVVQDFNVSMLPLGSEVTLADRASHALGINSTFIDKLNTVVSYVPNLNDKLEKASGELLLQATVATGKVEETVGEIMTLSAGGFPKPAQNIFSMGEVRDPTLTAAVSDVVLQNMFNRFFSKELPVNKSVLKSVSITGPKTITFDGQLNAILVTFAGGNLKTKEGSVGTDYTIDNATIEMLPSIRQQDGHFYLDFHAVVTNLDLKNVIDEVDKMIAWTLQLEFLNDHVFGSVDLSSVLSRKLDLTIKGQKELSTGRFRYNGFATEMALENLACRIQQGSLSLLASMKIKDGKIGSPFADVATSKPSAAVEWLGSRFKLDCHAFPTVKPVPLNTHPEDSDVRVDVKSGFMQDLVINLLSHAVEIPLSQDSTKEMSDHYFVINKIRNLPFDDSNRIQVGISGDLWLRISKPVTIKTKLTVDDLELVVVPDIVQKDTSTYLVLTIQIKNLKIDGVLDKISQCLANFATDKGYLKEDSLDLTKSLLLTLKNPLDSTLNIAPKIKGASIFSDQTAYHIRLKTL